MQLAVSEQKYVSVNHTLKRMRRLALIGAERDRILEAADRLSGSGSMSTARRIHDWVRDRVEYVRDPSGVEEVQSPIATLQIGVGDCDDMSILAASLMRAAGHQAAYRAVALRKAGQYDHVYVAFGDRYRYALDPTISQTPGPDPHLDNARSVKQLPLSAMRVTGSRDTSSLASPQDTTTTTTDSTSGDTEDSPQWLQALQVLADSAPGIITPIVQDGEMPDGTTQPIVQPPQQQSGIGTPAMIMGGVVLVGGTYWLATRNA